jgi:FtsP/CotA-like multicopper oxidase with cupredoxin domain
MNRRQFLKSGVALGVTAALPVPAVALAEEIPYSSARVALLAQWKMYEQFERSALQAAVANSMFAAMVETSMTVPDRVKWINPVRGA